MNWGIGVMKAGIRGTDSEGGDRQRLVEGGEDGTNAENRLRQ